MKWCDAYDIHSIQSVRAFHVAAWVEDLTRSYASATVKQQLAAIKSLYDWLVVKQVVPHNPAAPVRGPRQASGKGKTPVLTPEEARQLLESIEVHTVKGLRDRALIALMLYSFARVGAVLSMQVSDVFFQQKRMWVRLHEKGGKLHDMPALARRLPGGGGYVRSRCPISIRVQGRSPDFRWSETAERIGHGQIAGRTGRPQDEHLQSHVSRDRNNVLPFE